MKCKISKLFFLGLIGVMSLNGYSQTDAQRKEIVKGYDLKKLDQLAIKFKEDSEASYAKGLQIAKDKGLPISGVTPGGAYFSLRGVDPDTGELVYFQTSNNTSTNSSVQTVRSQHLYDNGSLGLTGIQGLNMNIGIWDGGIPQQTHQNLGVSRVIVKYNGTSSQVEQEGIDHATHVAGTMIGNGSARIAARGISFESKVWANFWLDDLTRMTNQASQGLLISNHSYGDNNRNHLNNPGIFGRYNQRARDVDNLLFNSEKYQPVYAAGNDGQYIGNDRTAIINPAKNGFDQMINETVAKNTVVVAAIEGMTNYANASGVVRAGFSQSGPTDDFRIKPDISAKGVAVYSSAMPESTSVDLYDTKQGTSMAAPAVTAVFALWQQYSMQLWPSGLSGSLSLRSASIRALMAHTANPALTVGPNARTGWGVLNAEGGAIVMKDAAAGNAVFKELELVSGTNYEMDVTLDGTQPLKVTIAWTDRPGNIVNLTDSRAPVLINDLDLRVERPGGQVLMPWSLTKTLVNPVAVTNADNNCDNIEKIEYQSSLSGIAPAGVYKVKVSHKRSLVSGSQKFSLIVSGGVSSFEEADPNVSVDNSKIESLRIFPNPATDLLNISADVVAISDAKVTIYDVLGKKVYQNESLFNFSGDAIIDVSNFNKGVYLVEILKDNKKDTRKVVIK